MKRRYRTGGHAWVRERNLAIMLNYLWEAGGPVSRTHLVEVSGLNKSTVGSLLAQLQSWGLVKESGMSEPRPGRPGVLIDLNPDAGRLIGAEIGVDYISVVVTDLKANVAWCRKVDTNGDLPRQEQILSQTEDLIQEGMAQAVTGDARLFGIGLGVPGLVDHTTGTLLFAPNLKWRNLPLREMWRKRFDTLVVVENDARASALGEWMLGAARQVDNFIYLSAGVGLGGGVMINGRLYGGIGGFAGEVGHMTLEPDGPPCNCGNRGCWEVLVGPTAIVERVRRAAQAGQAPIVLGLSHGEASAIKMEHVLQAAAQNELAVIAAFEHAGRYLGIGIANLVNAFNPSLVVLGGVLSLAAPYVLPRAQQELEQRALDAARDGVRITVSAFKFDACVMGGAALILREILNNPAAWQPNSAPVEEHQMPASAL